MSAVTEAIEDLAQHERFSGVVRVDAGGKSSRQAFGFADRRSQVPNTIGTRFALASGTKGLTALTIVGLIEDGALDLATTARSLLGADLPMIDDGVTVEHLLAHRSGIGDYFDESEIDDIAEQEPPAPVQTMTSTGDYLPVLDGRPMAFPPGTRFAYNNGGYVVLAVIAERVSGVPFEQLVLRRVCDPAGMTETAFHRSDELPGGVATGYLRADGLRTNVFHLPMMGSGDGGIYSTAADLSSFWDAFFSGRIVSERWATEMVRPRSDWPEEERRYGLGFHLHRTSDVVWLEGYDAGASFISTRDPASGTTATVISNTTEGAWSLAILLDQLLGLEPPA